MPLPCDNTSRDCDSSVRSPVSAHESTDTQPSSPLVLPDAANLLSVSDRSQPSHSPAYDVAHSDTVMTSPSPRQSQVHSLFNSLHSFPANDLVSQLHIHLAPLSDFLTQHLALLQTWLSCASYGHLVALLCRHIAQVNCID